MRKNKSQKNIGVSITHDGIVENLYNINKKDAIKYANSKGYNVDNIFEFSETDVPESLIDTNINKKFIKELGKRFI